MSVKEPVQDQEALLKALKMLAVGSAALDTHKNLLVSGKKGREKYANTDFGNADSILENQIEGTDVAEAAGFEPGGLPAYLAGGAYDILNPVDIALAAATKLGGLGGKLAKLITPLETASEEAGKALVKNKLPKYIAKEVRNIKDIPLSKRIAEEAIKTGASKQLSNPTKALKILQGEKKMITTGGTKHLPIQELKKSEGSLDKVGKALEETVINESKTAPKVNKANIYRKEMKEAAAENNKGIKYKKSMEAKSKTLDDALSPFVEGKIPTTLPKKKMKNATGEDLEQEVSALETLLNSKKKQNEAKLSEPPPIPGEPPAMPRMEPPPVPGSYDGMGLEDIIATMADKRAAKSKVDEANKLVDIHNSKIDKLPKTVSGPVDSEVPLEELWRKKIELRKEFKDSTYGKPMHEWTDKDRTLQSVIEKIDDEIVSKMSIPGQDAFKGLNQKYSAQSKLANIFEDKLQQETGKGAGQAARIGTEAAAGGVTNPATAGRMVKSAYDFLLGPKRMVQLGNGMQKRKFTTPMFNLASEGPEALFDEPYLKDQTERTEDAPIDLSPLGEGWEVDDPSAEVSAEDDGRSPASTIQVPEAKQAQDAMAPDDAPIDLSPLGEGWEVDSGEEAVPEAPKDPIDHKMDEALMPQKPLFDPYMNDEILNTILPRDTDRLLKNQTALMAKMQQVAPNQVPVLKDMLEHDQEGLKDMAPKLALMFPALFERDKYGMFDGKIIDPMMQEKFLADLSHDEGMDNIAKADLAMKVRRGESIHS